MKVWLCFTYLEAPDVMTTRLPTHVWRMLNHKQARTRQQGVPSYTCDTTKHCLSCHSRLLESRI